MWSYSIGRCYSPQTGRAYIGTRPSKKKLLGLCQEISELTRRRWTYMEADELVGRLNRKLIGWANYFSLGSVSRAYRLVDAHVGHRLRMWLNAKHKVRHVGKRRFIDAATALRLGLDCLQGRKGSLPWVTA